MRSKFPVGFRAWGAAFALCCATLAPAAETHPLMGAGREQVLERYGEPRSTVVRGDRELFFYPRERLTLRNGVVVEVERLAAEAPKRQESAPAPTPTPAPVTPTVPVAETPAPTPAENTVINPGSSPATETAPVAPPPPPPEPRLEIKRVLPPGSGPSRPALAPKQVTQAPAPATKATTPAPTASRTAPAPTPVASGGPAADPVSPAPNAGAATPTAANPSAATSPNPASTAMAPGALASVPAAAEVAGATTPPAPEPIEPVKTDDPDLKKKDVKKAVDVKAARRRQEQAAADAIDPAAAAFTTRTYVIGALIIGAGVGYIVWRRRQRTLELAATAVSHAPFSAPTASGQGAIFKLELLTKLEWKRFEELVVAYYSKTGVVATRTKSGPAAPVHIKISWKGESRPFALVQCIAQPPGLIDVKPIHDLQVVLATEDIRRGYVVTTGKFNVPARDFAEEKHITLLPGDIFVEKLNALPDTARNELMQQMTAGDYATPSCPKCEAKMVRSAEDPTVWQCTAHPEQQIPARK